jgi:hypothetical protein
MPIPAALSARGLASGFISFTIAQR